MIPKIDSDIGILAYTTDFLGCGGTIRKQKEDFNVSELITEKSSSRICSDSGFAVYKLQKNHHFVFLLFHHSQGILWYILIYQSQNQFLESHYCHGNKLRNSNVISVCTEKNFMCTR